MNEKVKRLENHVYWGIHSETGARAWNPVMEKVSYPVSNWVDFVENDVWNQLWDEEE